MAKNKEKFEYVIENKKIDNLLDSNEMDNKRVVLSNQLARQKSQFTLEEEKLLFCVLSHLDPYRKNPEKLEINKQELFEKLELTSSTRYRELKSRFQSMAGKTWVDIRDDKGETYGFVITSVFSDFRSDVFEVDLNPRFMPYIQELASHYTQLELDSIVQFDSKYSLILYKYLSSWKDGNWEHYRYLTTKQLKDLFGLEENDYMRKNGTFDRYNFEKRTIDTAIDEINAKVPNILIDYSKKKRGNRIQAYIFEFLDIDKLKQRRF